MFSEFRKTSLKESCFAHVDGDWLKTQTEFASGGSRLTQSCLDPGDGLFIAARSGRAAVYRNPLVGGPLESKHALLQSFRRLLANTFPFRGEIASAIDYRSSS